MVIEHIIFFRLTLAQLLSVLLTCELYIEDVTWPGGVRNISSSVEQKLEKEKEIMSALV